MLRKHSAIWVTLNNVQNNGLKEQFALIGGRYYFVGFDVPFNQTVTEIVRSSCGYTWKDILLWSGKVKPKVFMRHWTSNMAYVTYEPVQRKISFS